jgi:hypothetical protein
MARSSRDDGQLSFDIDALIHAAEVAAAPKWQGASLHFTTGCFSPAALDEAFEHWCFLNGHHNSIALSHMWHRYIGLNQHIDFQEHSIDTFDAELRCLDQEHRDGDEDCSCVGGRLVQAICEPCGWHVLAEDENTVVEAWHDHAVPGWRELPVVPERIRVRDAKGLTRHAREWIAEHYPVDMQVSGAPIITERAQYATRHVPGYSPWGGFDISFTAVGGEAKPRAEHEPSSRRARLAPTEPATPSTRARGNGLGL